MCDISASRKSLAVVFLKLFLSVIGINAQANNPQFYPNPAYNPRPNLQTLNGYEFRQNNPQFGGAGVLYQVDDRQNPQGYAPPNFAYRDPKRAQGFERVDNIPNGVNDPRGISQNPGNVPQISGNIPQISAQNPQQIPINRGQNPLNPGQIPFDERNRVNGDIRKLLQDLDVQASQQCTNNVAAQWNFETNVNEATQAEAVSIHILESIFNVSKIGIGILLKHKF